MNEQDRLSPEQVLIREMGLTEQAIERRKKYVGLEKEDLARIAMVRDLVSAHATELAASFFEQLAGLDEARPFLANREGLATARRLKTEHLSAMVSGSYETPYVEERITLGLLYSRLGLDPRLFLGAFHALLEHVGSTIMKSFQDRPAEGFACVMSLTKVAFFDIGIIVDVIVFERERIIRQQQEAIRELSTPVLQIRDRLLLLPIIGVVDTHRARLVTENLLRTIRDNRARVVVMDVTGVVTIDSKVANHLLQTVSAARLMGARVIVTGLSSQVAQSLVALGIELDKFNTVGDLEGGLEEAERLLGYRVHRADESADPHHA